MSSVRTRMPTTHVRAACSGLPTLNPQLSTARRLLRAPGPSSVQRLPVALHADRYWPAEALRARAGFGGLFRGAPTLEAASADGAEGMGQRGARADPPGPFGHGAKRGPETG